MSNSTIAKAIGSFVKNTLKNIVKELTSPYDGTLGSFFQYGASELANIVLHGHAAPVYSHSMSPAQASALSEPVAPQSDLPKAATEVAAEMSSVDATANAAPTVSASTEPVVTAHGPTTLHEREASADKGILSEYMKQIASFEQSMQQEQELSR